MTEIKDFVSRTSLYIAGMRAFETERSDRLFEDPFAADLAGNEILDSWSDYWHFGCDNPEQLFAQYGWNASVVKPGDEGANYNRYKKPRPPREVLDVARTFFVTAKKTTEFS